MGGVARRATYVERARAAGPGALLVDTGSALFGSADGAGASADRYLARALALMGYDVLNVGAGEARAGPLAAAELAAPGAPALVASAGPAASSPLALAKPYVVRETGGVRVGFVGVASPEGPAGEAGAPLPATTLEALARVLPEVRRQADVVVALADLEPDQAAALAGAGLDLDVVLGGRSLASRPAERMGRAIVATAGGADYVGRLTLRIDAGGKVVSFDGEQVFLDENLPERPDLLALREQYR